MKHSFSSPCVAQLYYFSNQDDQDLKKLWDSFRTVCQLDSTASKDVLEREKGKARLHYIQSLINEKLGLYIFRDRNVLIFEIVLFGKGNGGNSQTLVDNGLAQIRELQSKLDKIIEAAFGKATVIVETGTLDDLSWSGTRLGRLDKWLENSELLKTELVSGLLLHFADGFEYKHNYYIYMPSDQQHIRMFLLQYLPLIDVKIQKTMLEANYFLEQLQSIEKERKETDKTIDSILHRGVIVTEEGTERIDYLQGQVKDLSRFYGILAEGTAITRSAYHKLKSDIQFLKQQIETQIVNDSIHQALKTGHLYDFDLVLDKLSMECDLLEQSLQNARAALDVVHSRVDLEQSTQSLTVQDQTRKLLDQNVVLQKEGISLQVAAVFIEFVVVFYYSLHSWETLARTETFHNIHAVVQFTVILGFTTSVILCTHFAAKKIEKPGARNMRLWLSLLAIFLSLASIIGITLFFTGH